MGRLDTCYAPVRRSPSIKASFDNAAPRLACVKPVASVHPEPGSNSSLYNIFIYIRREDLPGRAFKNSHFLFRNDGSYLFLLYYNFCLWNYVKELLFFVPPRLFGYPRRGPCFSFAGAKVQQFRKPPKHYTNFFQKNLIQKQHTL